MKTLNICFVALVAGLAAANSLRAAVQDAAFLQGSTLADGSAYLNSATPKAIAWTEKSSIDPGTFEHSFVEPAKLMVKQDGDYLVAATMPIISIDDNDNRPCQALEVYVNGEPAPGTVGSSGYIRNQPRNANMHRETSDHAHALLADLSAGDIIEVRAYKTAQPAIRTQIQSASLYVERVDESRTVFAALSDGPTQGTNLNADLAADEDPAQLAWTSTRKDSGITHNNGSEEIRLSAGTYMLFVNIPMQSTVQRASAGLEILLGQEFPAAGFTAFQGYIRNASGHNKASVHWAGIFQVEGTETLILQTLRQAQAGNVTIQPDKQASVYLEKIDDGSGLLSVSAIGVNNNANNWNPASKVAVKWDNESINDSSLFRRSGPNNTGIQIQQAGHYLLLYQDTLFTAPGGGPDRPNPRISIEVNGQEVQGAETKTHYIRDANDHNESSASLVFLLENLAANDTITVSAQREGQTGTVFSADQTDAEYEGGASLSLIQKESLADPGSIQSAPRLVSATGDINGFQARIQNFSASVDEDSVQATLNGEAVTPEVSTSGGLTTISYNFPEVPASMSVHQVSLSFSDTSQSLHQTEFQFTVREIFVRIPPEFKASGMDTDAPGFVARVSQISTEQSGVAHVHGNTLAGAERQQAGEYTNAEGDPYLNEAGPANADAWEFTPVDVETVINFEEGNDGTPGPTGIFNVNNGAEDEFIPQIPDSQTNKDGIVAEFLTFLELSQGFHTFGVNSDDGFEVTSGPSLKDQASIVLGLYDGSRGTSETRFSVYVEEDGIYPVRLLWWEGGGGASVEFYSILENGDRILINDRENSNAIKAYRSATARPYISSVSPTGTAATDSIEYTINDDEISVVDGSVNLTLNGAALDPEVAKSGSVTTVRYVNPDGYFPGGTHVAVLAYNESSDPVVTRTFRHEFTVPEGQTVVVRDSPFAYWRLGETEADATRAINEISEFHMGTYQNNPGLGAERLVLGDPSAAVLFEAEKQHWISIPNHADINNLGGNPGWPQKTIEFWFKARNLPNSDLAHPDFDISQRQVIYEQGGATRGMNVYLEGIEDGQNPAKAMLWFNVLNRAEVSWGGTAPYNEDVGVGIDQAAVAISTEIEKDTVYHVALVFEEDTGEGNFEGGITGYLNGEKFGETTGANQLRNHTDGIGIGRRNNEVSFHDLIVNASTAAIFNSSDHLFYYDGWLDEFALYNVALTAEQIKAHYEAGLMEVPVDPGTLPPPIAVGINSIALVAFGDDRIVVHIEYNGTLKSAATVNGPFVEVEGASSPFSVTPDQEKMFYIVE